MGHGCTPIAGWLLLGKIPSRNGMIWGYPHLGNHLFLWDGLFLQYHGCINRTWRKKTERWWNHIDIIWSPSFWGLMLLYYHYIGKLAREATGTSGRKHIVPFCSRQGCKIREFLAFTATSSVGGPAFPSSNGGSKLVIGELQWGAEDSWGFGVWRRHVLGWLMKKVTHTHTQSLLRRMRIAWEPGHWLMFLFSLCVVPSKVKASAKCLKQGSMSVISCLTLDKAHDALDLGISTHIHRESLHLLARLMTTTKSY